MLEPKECLQKEIMDTFSFWTIKSFYKSDILIRYTKNTAFSLELTLLSNTDKPKLCISFKSLHWIRCDFNLKKE